MPMRNIQLFSVPVSDPERAKAFYVETLGWELVRDEPMGPDQRWLEVKPRGSQTSITLVTWFESMQPGSMRGVVIETDDLEGDRDTLRDRGVKIGSRVEEAPWGRWVTFEDPDGNGYVLQSSAPRGEEATATGSTGEDRDLQDAFD
jgi:predicted enzyme related to lactoylglutathione lyase